MLKVHKILGQSKMTLYKYKCVLTLHLVKWVIQLCIIDLKTYLFKMISKCSVERRGRCQFWSISEPY